MAATRHVTTRRRRVQALAGRVLRRAITLAMCLVLAPLAAAAAEPRRIVSLNVCIDQVLVDLVDKERIAAVTFLATDPLTVVAPARAAGLKTIRGSAEEVLALDPDLVLAGRYTTPATVDLLRRLGRRVEIVPLPSTIAEVIEVVRTIARHVGAEVRGEALVAGLEQHLRRAVRPDRPSALIYQVNNFVSSPYDLADKVLAAAGLANAAGRLVAARSGQVTLEAILAAPPDLLVMAGGPSTYRTAVADNLRHPALARLLAGRPHATLPWPLLLCGTHHVGRAIEALATARDRIGGEHR